MVCVVAAVVLLGVYLWRASSPGPVPPHPVPTAPSATASAAATDDPAEAATRVARAYLKAAGEGRSSGCDMMISGLRSQCRADVGTTAPASPQPAYAQELAAMRDPVYVTPENGTQGAFVCVRLSRVMIQGQQMGNCPAGTDLRMSMIKESDGWKVAGIVFGFSDISQLVGP